MPDFSDHFNFLTQVGKQYTEVQIWNAFATIYDPEHSTRSGLHVPLVEESPSIQMFATFALNLSVQDNVLHQDHTENQKQLPCI